MDKKVSELLNAQINKEFYSAYLYLDFANYFERRGLSGFAHWYEVQAQEERDHAMLFYRIYSTTANRNAGSNRRTQDGREKGLRRAGSRFGA